MENDDFRSVNEYLGKLSVDELRILHEQMAELQQHPAFASLKAMLLLDREQHSRMLSKRGAAHHEVAWEGGYVRGAAVPFAIFHAVATKHVAVQKKLHRDIESDGES